MKHLLTLLFLLTAATTFGQGTCANDNVSGYEVPVRAKIRINANGTRDTLCWFPTVAEMQAYVAEHGGSGSTTIYTGDGTLEGDRTVDCDGHALAIQNSLFLILTAQEGSGMSAAPTSVNIAAGATSILFGDVNAQTTTAGYGGATTAWDNVTPAVTTSVNGTTVFMDGSGQAITFTAPGGVTFSTPYLTITSGTIYLPGVPEYDDDAAAIADGAESNTLYKTTTGGSTYLKIVPVH